jgi:chromosome segregation ATPase
VSAGVVPLAKPPRPCGPPPLGRGGSKPDDLVEDHQNERAVLEARVREVRELLTTLDGLQAHLTGLAETALDHADAAPTLDERRRYERLYTETSARLGELQATRAEIERQIDLLETQLEAAPGGR